MTRSLIARSRPLLVALTAICFAVLPGAPAGALIPGEGTTSASPNDSDARPTKRASSKRSRVKKGSGRNKSSRASKRGRKRVTAKRSRRGKKGRRRGRGLTRAYRAMRARWHEAPLPSILEAWKREDPRPLVIRPVGNPIVFHLLPDSNGATFGPSALALARKAFTYKRNGAMHTIHPRLLTLLYRAVKHFEAPYLTLVSGYRTGRATSRHTQGRAADIALPGVRDKKLVAFLREQGFVGVGHYPTSGFVHLDVRAESFFWTDRSGPGRRSRLRQVAAGEAHRQDARARDRGEAPLEELVPARAGEDDGESPDAIETAAAGASAESDESS